MYIAFSRKQMILNKNNALSLQQEIAHFMFQCLLQPDFGFGVFFHFWNNDHSDECEKCFYWKVEGDGNSVSNAFASTMASHAMYNNTFHDNHAGLISQDSSADEAASWDMSALNKLSLLFLTVAELEWKVVWEKDFRFSPCFLLSLQFSSLWAAQAIR